MKVLKSFGLAFAAVGLSVSVAAQPTAPTALQATVSGNTVTLMWSYAGVASSFVLDVASAPGAPPYAGLPVSGTLREMTAAGVAAANYYVSIRAVVGGLASAASNEVLVSVGGPCTPLPVGAQLRSLVTGTQVTLDWSNTNYETQLEAGSLAGASDLAILRFPRGQARLIVVVPFGRYFVRARHANACGFGGASNEVELIVNGTNTTCIPNYSPRQQGAILGVSYFMDIFLPSGCAWTIKPPLHVTAQPMSGIGSGRVTYQLKRSDYFDPFQILTRSGIYDGTYVIAY